MKIARTDTSSAGIRLRLANADDLGWMAEMAADPDLIGPHNWGGAREDEDWERSRNVCSSTGFSQTTWNCIGCSPILLLTTSPNTVRWKRSEWDAWES